MTATITRDEVQAGVDAGTLVLVDALPESYYAQQHLPGAVNLVADDVDTRAATLLPDKHAAIVTSCSNRACPNSGQVATRPQIRAAASCPCSTSAWCASARTPPATDCGCWPPPSGCSLSAGWPV